MAATSVDEIISSSEVSSLDMSSAILPPTEAYSSYSRMKASPLPNTSIYLSSPIDSPLITTIDTSVLCHTLSSDNQQLLTTVFASPNAHHSFVDDQSNIETPIKLSPHEHLSECLQHSFKNIDNAEEFSAVQWNSNKVVTGKQCAMQRYRPIKPVIQKTDAIKENIEKIDCKHLKPKRKKKITEDCISIENCKLNTIDSHNENIVIVLNDFDRSPSEVSELDKLSCFDSLEASCDIPDNILRSDYVEKNDRTYPIDDSLPNEEIHAYLNDSQLSNYNKIDFYHPNSVSKCILCNQSQLECRLREIHTVIRRGRCNTFEILGKIVDLKSDELNKRSTKICSSCLGRLEEIEQIREKLQKKESEVRDMFNSFNDIENKNPCVVPNWKSENNRFREVLASRENISKKHKLFRCLRCHTSFPNAVERKNHMRECKVGSLHYEEQPENNNNIEKAVSSPTITPNRRQKKYSCDHCDMSFLRKRSLLNHRSCLHEGSFDCTVCGRYLTTKARLQAHMFKFHGIGKGKNKNVSCDMCEKTFQTKPGLYYHKNVIHKVGKEYTCEYCNKMYYHHAPYRSHMLFSHGKRNVVCETCGDMFFTVSKLNTHINTVHRSALTWHCVDCDTRFTSGATYRRHVAIKHGKAKLSCDHCSATFRNKTSLYSHLKEHSIYVCKLCSNHFNSQQLYNAHMFDVHKQVLPRFGKKRSASTSCSSNSYVSKKSKNKVYTRQKSAIEKNSKATVNPSLRLDINELLGENSYNETNGLQCYSHRSDNLLTDSNGKDYAFNTLSSEITMEMNTCGDTSANTLVPINNSDISFINVEILDNIEIGTEGNGLSPTAHQSSVPPPHQALNVVNLVAPGRQDCGAPTNLSTDVNDIEPSVLSPTVDIEASVTELDSVPHSLSGNPVTVLEEPSPLWIKENDWAMLKGSAHVENISSLQSIGSATMQELDIGGIDGGIVESDVITGTDSSMTLCMTDDKEQHLAHLTINN